MKVVIFTEAGRGIGFGHFTRCLSLYQAFEEQGVVPKFVVKGDESIEDIAGNRNLCILDWIKEEQKSLELLNKADVMIIDSYLAKYSFYEKASILPGISLYIDDYKRINYPAGIVLNGSIYAEEIDYHIKDGIKYLLGAEYMPLRKGFWEVSGKDIKETIESIMVTFGGEDTQNVTPKILKILKIDYPELTKNIIIGKGFQNLDEIKELADNRTNLIYNPDAEGMKKIMLDSDIAISAGGQTLYELARVGVPAIGICLTENQRLNLEGWEKSGFVKYIGWYDEKELSFRLSKNIDSAFCYDERIKASRVGKSFVDGKGAEKILRMLLR